MMRAIGTLLLAGLLLSACAGPGSPPVAPVPEPAPSIREVRADPERHTGQRVRWGGTIAAVENRADETWVEIVERDLDRDGRPRDEDRSGGRFLARLPGFLDPSIHARGRALTVNGLLAGELIRPIGEFPYRYPVVRADAHHLWQPLPDPVPARLDPFWYPYPWGWWGHPFHRPWPHGPHW